MKGLERIVLAYLRLQMMDYWLPDGEATVCEIRLCVIWWCAVQELHRDCAVSILVHPVQLRFSIQLQVTDSALVRLIIREAEGVQSTSGWFCGAVWEESSASVCEKDERDPLQKREDLHGPCLSWDRMWCGWVVQVPGHPHQQADLEDQHRGCTQEVDE